MLRYWFDVTLNKTDYDKLLLPYLGEFDLEKPKGYYELTIDFNGEKIKIDLRFGGGIDVKRLDIVKKTWIAFQNLT